MLIAFCALSLSASASQIGDGDLPRDRQRNRWFHWEPSPTTPLVCSADGRRLYAANQPGARIAVFDVATRAKLREIPVGTGVVALALRPASFELWAVDAISSTVTVIDTRNGVVGRTIGVGAGANGIAFTPSGDRAYLACSDARSVDVVRTQDYALVQSIPFPALAPRGIVCTGTEVRVVSFTSGNGTAPRGNPSSTWTDDIVEVRHVDDFAGTNPLPDRDLVTITVGAVPGNDVIDVSKTVTGLGSTLYNLHHRPGTNEVWIPGIEALNADFVGERNFVAGKVVSNRIAVVAPAGTKIIDLDALTGTAENRCGTPTSIAFTSDGARAFVTGYGSDTIAVLDLSGVMAQLEGLLRVRPEKNYPDGAGPRVAIVTPLDTHLVVSNKGDNTLTWFDLEGLPGAPGYDIELPPASDIGWDPLPLNVKQGRIHFIRTQNSLSGTSSCDSCHVDGHSDALAWDLSPFLDPEGTPRELLGLPLDRKGPMVTQSVRGLREVGPYHWRGDRKHLVDFNAAFTDLLERHEDGELADLGGKMVYVGQYMDLLAPRPNPRQAADRKYTATELAGADLFLNKAVKGALKCASCHPLPMTTSGEMTVNHLGGFSPTSKITSLRAVADKLSPPYLIGDSFDVRTEIGAGLGHGGNSSSISDVALALLPPPESGQVFQLTPDEAAKIAMFLEALDTGIAPAAVFQATANAANASTFLADELAYLISQAEAGNCQAVYSYGPGTWNGFSVYFTGVYDPAIGRFRPASTTLPTVSSGELVNLAAAGTPVTFRGVPAWTGEPMGIDRDNDAYLDLDERLAGTNPEKEDTDEDGYPDGYEVEWGMNPLVENQSSPDSDQPELVGDVHIVWTTVNSAKIEFVVDEAVRALFSYDGGYPLLRWPLFPSFDTHFSVVLNELLPGRQTQVTINVTDPSGNTRDVTVPVRTRDRTLPAPVRVDDIAMQIVEDQLGDDAVLISVRLRRDNFRPSLGYNVRANLYFDSPTNGPSLVKKLQTWLVRIDGIVEFRVDVPPDIQPGSGDFVFAIQGIDAVPGRPPHVRGEDVEQRDRLTY